MRVDDHAPLALSADDLCLPVYVFEPAVMQAHDFDASHQRFINQSLLELDAALRQRGAQLLLLSGNVPEVFEKLHEAFPFSRIVSHEETGNAITYKRDLALKEWTRRKGVEWLEYAQTGVVRRLKNRDHWAGKWLERMTKPIIEAPPRLVLPPHIGDFSFSLMPHVVSDKVTQPGGESKAKETLASFLSSRGRNYQKEMSSPVTAEASCSRLSPYITWGNISLKRVYQASRQVKRADWQPSMRSFQSRLWWHCHFMQKLEDEPEIEFHNFSRAYDGLREDEFNSVYFQAWCEGMTGYPFVDACMRALHQTSWLNFRMRAMLVSFAAYHLWLHWKPCADFLARHFLDYEPGIHYSQFQMQSGVTGINTVRIYSPAKQATEQDPQGHFIRQYVPELANLPAQYLARPELTPPLVQQLYGVRIGVDYPEPIVDEKVALNRAKERIFTVRKTAFAMAEADRVQAKHGSRRT
ncbi:MAG: deoxyribodipyrimidine photo-lyase/cryptochrome family protein [Candidatus Obscuribacter phosphatis]|uniref:Deoxyribodipyrimidine photo-lyase/cryptochrome family protein n=1 Tax=Candidatus Obscuribacter phosphatis TaxID=1906157 RepID=A0A8J7PPH7_9BACT|nr:deoxyribodipyrimidine photo-lyase/cryptochrome family protein [Candidatus Obscuribacter phosphatis]